MGKGRGRHQSTDKEGKRTIDTLERIPGVEAVFINRSIGGKSIGRKRAVGDFRGILQTSKGIQEIFIRVSRPADAELRRRLKAYSV